MPLEERIDVCLRFLEAMQTKADEIGEELTWQMGRPVRYSPNEIRRGFTERTRYMAEVAPEVLADVRIPAKAGFTRFIRKDPVGVVLTIAPWNYPYLSSVKFGDTCHYRGQFRASEAFGPDPLCAERYSQAFQDAGLPEGVFQFIHTAHDDVARMIGDERIRLRSFTGSVEGGHAIRRLQAEAFIGVALELGGKDPAYVRADANLGCSRELVDGAMFNSGQSCCGIERIYVHRDV